MHAGAGAGNGKQAEGEGEETSYSDYGTIYTTTGGHLVAKNASMFFQQNYDLH